MKVPLKQYGGLLVRYLRPQWPAALLLAALILGNIGLQLLNPQIMRRFIDATQAPGAAGILGQTALLFLAVALAQQGVSVAATYLSEQLGWATTNALRAELAEHCLRLDLWFHNAHTPGELIERIDGDVTALANFFSQFILEVVGNALLLLGVLALLFTVDWRVGLTLGGFALLALMTLGSLRGVAVPHWTAERQASAELFGFLEERLAGTEDIRACGAQAYVMRGFYRLVRAWMQRALKAGLMVSFMVNATSTLVFVGPALALAVGAYLYARGQAPLGTVYLIFHYSAMLTNPINRLTTQLQDLQRAGAGIARIQELFAVQRRIRSPELAQSERVALPTRALAVAFQNVSFGYPAAPSGKPSLEGELVLRDISFHLPPGRVLGLLGRTGSGKTTLTRLLLRFYEPQQGAICLGGELPASLHDIRQLDLAALRQRVGLVTQEIQLFHASVRDNLTFFDPSIPDARVRAVIQDVGLGAWYAALPDGLDTALESGGGGLSAGEAQLLALARIFLQNPGLVVLDEASSRLDPATEQRLEQAIRRLIAQRTAIIIAHRLGTVQRADDILILEQGCIREYGPRARLAADPTSRFYHLLQTGLEEVLA